MIPTIQKSHFLLDQNHIAKCTAETVISGTLAILLGVVAAAMTLGFAFTAWREWREWRDR
jgi:hypothetical protein